MNTSLPVTVCRSILLAFVLVLTQSLAFGNPLQSGDVLLGGPDGIVAQYRNGSRVGDLNTGAGAGRNVLGLCASIDKNYIYAVLSAPASGNVYRFNSQGELQGIPQATGSWLGLMVPALACIADRAGNVYVVTSTSIVGGSQPSLRKYHSDGSLASYYFPQGIETTHSIDLREDQCTLLYSSNGKIKQFDVCSNVQLSDLNQDALAQQCEAIRARANGETMVVCGNKVFRMNLNWQIKQSYEAQLCSINNPRFISINLAPDNTTFWAAVGGGSRPRLCQLDIESGRFLASFDPSDPVVLSTGVYGEPLAASRFCKRVFGRTLCVVKKFPFLQTLPSLPSVPR